MSSTKAAFFCVLAAVSLRAGVALLTERHPIFPAYYYTDAEIMDQYAADRLEAWRTGRPPPPIGSLSQKTQSLFLASIYRVFGRRPLAGKLVNAAAAGAALALLFALFRPIFGAQAALGACALAALWPSHIFFTSQLFKDAVVMLLCYGALAGLWRSVERGAAAPLAAAVCCALLLGFFRYYLLLALCAAAAPGLAWALAAGGGRRFWTSAALAGVLAVALGFRPLARAVLAAADRADAPAEQRAPQTPDATAGVEILPRSPRGISEFRAEHQRLDLKWARTNRKREIGTQLFYGQRLETWGDLLLFLPKGMFYVLFMPLPLLYPINHNAGRLLASLENTGLLLVFALAVAGAWRGRKDPARAILLAFFLIMAAGSALLEFDLGSASRHRLLYVPLLFPFAVSALLPRRRTPRAGILTVVQALECGGPGGTGNQVAALCNALDPKRFKTLLAYGTRGTDAQAYRALAAGARDAFFLPELAREISPLRDLKALRRLHEFFLREAPDVVHAHSSKAGALARLAAWRAGVPRIFYSPHGYGFLQADRSQAWRAVYWVLEWSVSWIGEIVAVSPSEAALARPLSWGKPVHTVCDPFLGEIPESSQRAPHEGILVGGCGRLTAARNPQAFINLCQRLTDSRNGLRCVWIGGGEDEGRLRGDIENMNLGGKVEVTGWLDGQSARERMAKLDLFAHYSRWDALPNAVLEAMALGLPVVASDVPGCRDAVVHGETGFLAKTEIELLELCLRLADDPALRAKLGAAGRERVLRHFSQNEAVRRLESLYQAADDHLI